MEIFQERDTITSDFSSINSRKEAESFYEIATEDTVGSGLSSAERLVVIDSNVAISEQQMETFVDNEFAVLNLEANRNGIKQIKEALVEQQNINTIDIISHGERGSFTLGNTEINSDTLELYQNDLTGWTGVSQSRDILLYGCEIGATEAGRSFVEKFSTVTGADIAASDDLTGSARLQGDWSLEYHEGKIESIPLKIAGFNSVLGNENMLENSSFNEALDGTNWIVGKKGKVAQYDRNTEKVAYVEEVPGQGKQMHLKLPQEAKDNYGDQLAIFQDLSNLKTDKVYRVQAKVKWVNPENQLPSAIVSFWAKNPNGTFRGRDFTISDGNGYKNLQFEFTPTSSGKTRFFLGLFTHVNGNIDDTEILVDDYQVREIGEIAKSNDFRQGNLLNDGSFNIYNAEQTQSRPKEGWRKTVSSSNDGLNQSVMTVGGNDKLRLELPKAQNYKDEHNNKFTGVYQNVELVGGQSYNLSANFQRLGLNKYAEKDDSIVQFMLYRKRDNGEELFLGPIDVVLDNNKPVFKNFDLVAPDSGEYTILLRLSGWANEGNGVSVAADNVKLQTK